MVRILTPLVGNVRFGVFVHDRIGERKARPLWDALVAGETLLSCSCASEKRQFVHGLRYGWHHSPVERVWDNVVDMQLVFCQNVGDGMSGC